MKRSACAAAAIFLVLGCAAEKPIPIFTPEPPILETTLNGDGRAPAGEETTTVRKDAEKAVPHSGTEDPVLPITKPEPSVEPERVKKQEGDRGAKIKAETPAEKSATFEPEKQAPAPTKKPVSVGRSSKVERTPAGVEMEAGKGGVVYASPFSVKPVPVFLAVSDWTPPEAEGRSFPAVKSGTYYVCPYESSIGGYACRPENAGAKKPARAGETTEQEYFLIISRSGKAIGYMRGKDWGTWKDATDKIFKPQKTRLLQADPESEIRKRISYEGLDGNVAIFSYREYRGESLLSKKTKEYRHDVSGAPIVSVQDVRIEILEATAESVRYKILRR